MSLLDNNTGTAWSKSTWNPRRNFPGRFPGNGAWLLATRPSEQASRLISELEY